jgi:hypothetical protein
MLCFIQEMDRKLPLNPEYVFNLNAQIGHAVWQIQALEDTLAHLITIMLRVPQRVALEEAEEVLENVRKGTLGRLLKEIKESGIMLEGFEKRLDDFLSERNWLIHRSRRLHHADIYHDEKFEKLLKRIDTLVEESRVLNREFAAMLESYVISKGVKPEEITKIVNETLDKWVKGN